ncbi:MAG TPA: peptidoglycan editing factor PgeF [Xanthomonadaceae bacterium]|nr:peptidoglycan editing factor PgeF [Xanthomonadaceae bacterium]
MRAARAQVQASVLRADWPAPPGVHALTTLRGPAGVSRAPFDSFSFGLRNGDDAEAVAANRELLERGLELPSAPVWLRQVHGTRVVRVTHPLPSPPPQAGEGAERDAAAAFPLPPLAGEGWDGGKPDANAVPLLSSAEPEADAAITTQPGVVLAILTADCLPVVFAAEDGSALGAAHAGWRGLAAGVLEATVAALGTPPDRLLAWLGPAAGPAHYEIGAEVRDAFLAHDARAADAFVATRPGHWRVDLYALARQRLAAAGVMRMFGGDHCTIGEPRRFFSHRRDARSGRMATLVWRDQSP